MPVAADLMGDFDNTFPFEPRYLRVADDVRLHDVERGEGPPVLLLHGQPDLVLSSARRGVELPGARHYLQEDEPEAITSPIIEFLRAT